MDIKDLKNQIVFDESLHKYYRNKKEYISVSTLVKLYSPIFDPKGEIIKRCAEKKEITVEELRKKWDKERDDAGIKGKNIHLLAENWVNTGKIDKRNKYSHFIEQISKIPFKGKLYSENIIFSDKLQIAGTVDLLDIYDNNKCDLWDYKTNKKLNKKSFFNRDIWQFQMMLYPVYNLMDCNFIHYSLQLSIYSLILEELGLWMNDATLIYINPKTELIELHPISPLREEALKIIKHHKKMQSW